MHLVSIIYVSDMDRAAGFYEALGAEVGPSGRNPYWTEMTLGGSRFALHIDEPFDQLGRQRVGVSILADQPLEEVAGLLADRGIALAREIQDEPFGRSMVVVDPDGLAIQINEHA